MDRIKTNDLETRLDDALTRLANGVSPRLIEEDSPEAADFIQIAQRLNILAQTPEPHLVNGRRRFLNEAARLSNKPAGSSGATSRYTLAFIVVVFIILITGSTLLINELQVPSTRIFTPTNTATPTRIALCPTHTMLIKTGQSADGELQIPSGITPVPISVHEDNMFMSLLHIERLSF